MKKLIFSFFKIGLLTFGGGSSVVPICQQSLVTKQKIITEEEFIDIVAVANVLPGPSMIEIAASIGLLKYGRLAGFLCATAVAVPSILLFVVGYQLLVNSVDVESLMIITLPVLLVVGLSMVKTCQQFYSSTSNSLSPFTFFFITLSSFFAMEILNINASIIIILGILIIVIYKKAIS